MKNRDAGGGRVDSARRGRRLGGAPAAVVALVVASAAWTLTSLSRAAESTRPPAAGTRPSPASPFLRVCSDPNNLPFSNRTEQGFENRIAELLARDLHRTVQYTWWAQRRGFVRNTLNAGRCDVMLGAPAGWEQVSTTVPYYRSTYVFVYRPARGIAVRSLDDPALRRLRVGVPLVGGDGAETPPAHALARRGIVQNVRGFVVTGDYRQPNPPARIVDAVARGDIDIAIVWGPLGGYFASRERPPLTVVPVSPAVDGQGVPFAFDIAIGVRRGDTALRDALNAAIARQRAAIDRILDEYGVPRLEPGRDRAS